MYDYELVYFTPFISCLINFYESNYIHDSTSDMCLDKQ